MKTIFYFLLLNLFTITSIAQTYNVKIHTAGETVFTQTTDIDSITFDVSTNFTCGDNILWGSDVYPTVLIGTQCWFGKNLNVGTRINGNQNQTNNSSIEKYCYNDLETNCNTYGGLYQWNEAMQYSITPGTRGICPIGWHIPTYAELQTLSSTVENNSNALKAVAQGTGIGVGTNESGFSALLAGSRGSGGYVGSLGGDAFFWSSTENDATNAYYLYLYDIDSNIFLVNNSKDNGFSVRCLRD